MINHIEKINKMLSDAKSYLNKIDNSNKKATADEIKELKSKYSKLLAEADNIDIAQLVSYDVDQIEKSLGKIERGLNDTYNIEGHNKKLNDILESYQDMKSDIDSLNDDIETFEDEQKDEDLWGDKRASITEVIDKIASKLESKGLESEALKLDVISNTLETLN
jgi:predicted transcriptional regulator